MNKILSIAFILAIVLVLSEASKLRQPTWNCEYSSLQYKTKGFSLRYVCTSPDNEKVRSIVYFSRCKITPEYLKSENSSCKLSGETIKCDEGSVNISSILEFSNKKRKLKCQRKQNK